MFSFGFSPPIRSCHLQPPPTPTSPCFPSIYDQDGWSGIEPKALQWIGTQNNLETCWLAWGESV